MTTQENALPVLSLRGLVLLPGEVTSLDVGRPASRKAVDAALSEADKILLVPQQDAAVESIDPGHLYAYGVEADIVQATPVNERRYMVVVRPRRRVAIESFVQTTPYLAATAHPLDDTNVPDDDDRLPKVLLDLLAIAIERTGEDAAKALSEMDELAGPGELADYAARHVSMTTEQRLAMLSTADVRERLGMVHDALDRYVRVLAMGANIRDELEKQTAPEEREAALRARKRAILAELGEDAENPELDDLADQIAEKPMSDEAAQAARVQLRRMRQMSPASPEYSNARTYIDWLLALPWAEESVDRHDIAHARAVLDEDHDGLADVKKRVLEFIAVRKLVPEKAGPILCLVGPPGVGKTSLGKSIARALGREYVRASLGGVRDESEIRGHRRTYVGSLPGRIVSGLKKAGTSNPVFVLDEIDKLASDVRGDPASALLEVLDPEQNNAFVDHYIEVPIDLSKVMFLATANQLDTIPPPLLDRMEVIRIPGYTDVEKRTIGHNHLVPRQLEEHGLTAERVTVTDAAIDEIIHYYTREAGVRNLDREIAAVVRGLAVDAATEADWSGALVDVDAIPARLGPRRFSSDMAGQTDAIGVVTGMAWTPVGGQILFVEARRMPGRGNLHVTGQLGDVMSESVTAAHSWVRANAGRLGIDATSLSESDIHVHVPQGAVRKDGPSAGVAVATALVSLLQGAAVRHDVAITGEVTLRGLVLPVGGIKEKLLAAHRAGIRTVVIPERNRKDLHDLPALIRDELDVRFAARLDQALEIALAPRAEPTGVLPPTPHQAGRDDARPTAPAPTI